MSKHTQEDSEDDMDMDMMAPPSSEGPLFWSMKLDASEKKEIDQPAIEGYIVHITSACFGPNVSKGSRTVVMVDPSAEEEDDTAAPVCVLRQGGQENQSLDLLFNESASFSLKGQKVSPVYLTGYIQPPVDGSEPPMDPMYEDMDEEQIMSALKAQREQADALDADESEDEEVAEPPAKKQKTASGAVSKKSPKGQKNGDKKDKKRKGQKSDDEKNADEKKETESKKGKKQKKKGKEMQKMKGGIQYRDMKIGDGEVVKNGDKLRVFYVGQTDDKKVFDKCIAGKGFEFAFGKGDVIKGWDMGFKGMKVGGKRKLVIPPKQAYGAAGSPPNVPGNATLTFTIELKSAN